MKTILAGIDFTPSSHNAALYAAMLAKSTNSKLLLFNLFEVPVAHANSGLFFISYNAVREGSEDRMSFLMRDLRSRFARLKVDSLVVTGSFKKEIEKFVQSHQVEAVVLGLAAKTKLSRFIYGSHATDIAGKLTVPVIVVPEKFKEHRLRSILLGVDCYEKLRQTPMRRFLGIVAHTKAKVRVLHVRTKEEIFTPLPAPIKLNESSCKVETVFAKDVEEGINRYVAKNNCDMISIISRRHAHFYDFFAETHTRKLAFVSKVPVMAIHE